VNPVRKVVTLLQKMQTKVMAEGKKEEELFEKYQCYCRTNSGDLTTSIAEGNAKTASLKTAIEEAIAKKEQTEENLKTHQKDRAQAKEAMAQATAIREKEAAAFVKEKTELDANIAALAKAIAAIDAGMVGGFLQTSSANMLRKFFMEKAEINDPTRQELLAFFSATESNAYVPQSGEITGILRQIKDEMSRSLADAASAEEASIKDFKALMSAKKKEVEALSAQIEEEMSRIGELGVQIAGMKNDLEDTSEALQSDGDFLAELQAGCETKAKEWEEIKKLRAEELLALAETIKVLNDDDALELFKKTLPSAASSSLMQLRERVASVRSRAMLYIRTASDVQSVSCPELDLIALALSGQKIGFEKVIKMIDNMIATLKQEQIDDESKKEYCDVQLDEADDKKKGLEHSIAGSDTVIEQLEGSIATLKDDIKVLEAGIKALDKSVEEATAQRKSENEDYKGLMASDSAAKELLNWAKNRLHKFYNKALYKASPKRELNEEDSIAVSMGGTMAPTSAPGGIAGTGVSVAMVEISTHRRHAAASPPPPPETFSGYSKKTEESAGVIGMIDLLIKDLDKEMTEAEATETDSQADYEKLMADAAKKRADDTTAVTTKAATMASEEEDLQAEKDAKAEAGRQLLATARFIQSLHGECDWLLKYFDVRKTARISEIEALGQAKAVLKGADFSLMQTSTAGRVAVFLAPKH